MRGFKLEKQSMEASWQDNLIALAGILLVGIAVYAHTLNVPWYMDDIQAILENETVHSLRGAWSEFFSARGPANLSFALNYRFGGTNVTGYHLVNITIHLITSCLVFLLLKRVFRQRLLLAVGGALIFVAHPLQTQAVTYLVQRMTSLAALFFFLALYLYVRARETGGEHPTRLWLLYGGALVSGALAVLTKQNTAVLPVALILFDRYFLAAEGRLVWSKQFAYVAPFFLAPLALAIQGLLLPLLSEGTISKVGGMPDLVHLRHLSPLNYLVTEFSVIWLYLRLLVLPYGQALDYDLAIVAEILTWQNFAAFLGVAALLAAGFFLRRRLPLVSAGIFWFFLTLAVESTIIPLDPVFEHRLYLPMFGFVLVVMTLLARLPWKAGMTGIILLTLLLAGLSWQRNALWNDPIAFYEDNLIRAPRSERVHLDLANAYRRAGRLDEAERLYLRALEINPDYVLIHINLSMVYNDKDERRKAVAILQEGIRRNSSHFKLHNNLGALYNYLGQYEEAVTHLKKGAELEPNNATVHFNLALAYDNLGRLAEAGSHYRRSLALDPTNPESYFKLGLVLHRQGRTHEAYQAFATAARLNPSHTGTLYNLAMLSLDLGDQASAWDYLRRLQQLDPRMAQRLRQRLDQSTQGGG